MVSKYILEPVSFLETCIWSDRICELFVISFGVGTSIFVALNCQQPLSFILPSVKKKKRGGEHVWNREVNECWLMAMSFPRAKKISWKDRWDCGPGFEWCVKLCKLFIRASLFEMAKALLYWREGEWCGCQEIFTGFR